MSGPVRSPEFRSVLAFTLDGKSHALPLSSVSRVVRAVEVRSLPRAPGVVLGVIDVAGVPVPVMDLRARFALPSRPIGTADRFILARASGRPVALPVDSVQGVLDLPADAVVPDAAALAAHLEGIVTLPDGMVFLHDLEAFLSSTERAALDGALAGAAVSGRGPGHGPSDA